MTTNETSHRYGIVWPRGFENEARLYRLRQEDVAEFRMETDRGRDRSDNYHAEVVSRERILAERQRQRELRVIGECHGDSEVYEYLVETHTAGWPVEM